MNPVRKSPDKGENDNHSSYTHIVKLSNGVNKRNAHCNLCAGEQFSRHIRLPSFGPEGQKKISRAKVAIVGAGGLGSPSAIYLAATGIGSIGLIDSDSVEISNLPRQILYNLPNLEEMKVTAAKKRLKEINPYLKLNIFPDRLKPDNVVKIIKDYDVVIDGSDNFATKFLLNDACVINKIPLIHAGVLRYNGQVMTIIPYQSACYRCIFPEPPPANTIPTCREAGILNTVAGIIGLIQATEAIKLIIKAGKLLTNRLLIFDALEMNFRTIEIKRSTNCPVCSKRDTRKHRAKNIEHFYSML